jgi:16S rRNA (uracil1498-N3)-methyltransferase
MHRFFTTASDQLTEREAFIRDSELLHQWTKVLRFAVGESVILVRNNGYEYESVIRDIQKKEIRLEIVAAKKCETELPVKMILAQSFLKHVDRFEWSLQKGTELGFSEFIPLQTQRTERKIFPKFERWEKIVKEAAEQSGRCVVPKILQPLSLEKVFADYPCVVVPHPSAEMSFSDFKKKMVKVPEEIVFCVGPEGGFSDEEIALVREKGAHVVGLGPRVLRSETVGMVLGALVGDWVLSG